MPVRAVTVTVPDLQGLQVYQHLATDLLNDQPQLTLNGYYDSTPLTIPPITPLSLNFLESVEAAHSSHSFNDRVSTLLGITRPPTRVNSQAKYCCLARGDAGAYLRMRTGVGYREKIWVGS